MPYADDGELRLTPNAISRIGAFFFEPIQGEGGIRPLPARFLADARELADAEGFALVADEIQTGMGRTGYFFATEHARVRVDYALLGKSLGGGLTKIGALLVASDRYVEDFLYDLETDPHERNNLVADPSFADVRAELAVTLRRRMVEAGEAEPIIEPTNSHIAPQ